MIRTSPDRSAQHLAPSTARGSDPYGIRLPDTGIDGWWIGERNEPFMGYLNGVFAHGGFPYETGHPAQQRITAGLAEGMLEL